MSSQVSCPYPNKWPFTHTHVSATFKLRWVMKKKEEGEKEEDIKVKMDNWGRRRESAEMGRK